MKYLHHTTPKPYLSYQTNNIGYTMHQHSYVEVIYILSGQYMYATPGDRQIVHSGNLLLIFPYQLHSITPYQGEYSRMFSILFEVDFASDFEKRFCEYLMPNHILRKKELAPPTLTALHWLVESVQDNDSDINVLLQKNRGWLTVLLGDIFYKKDLKKRKEKLDSKLIDQLIHYIEQHIGEDFSQQDVTHALGISQNHLAYTLRDVLSISYNALVTSIRLEHAEKLLYTTDFSLLDIALECGFNNVQTFSRNYKKATGMTPGEFRRKH